MIPLLLAAAVAAVSPAETERLDRFQLQSIEALQKAREQLQPVSIEGPSRYPLAPAVTLSAGLGGFWTIDLNGPTPPFMSVPIETTVWGVLAKQQPAAYAAASAKPVTRAAGCDQLVLEAVMTRGGKAQKRYVSSCDTGPAGRYAKALLDLASSAVDCTDKQAPDALGRLFRGAGANHHPAATIVSRT